MRNIATSVIMTTWFARLVHNCLRNRMINRHTLLVASLQVNNRVTLMTDPAQQRFTQTLFAKVNLLLVPMSFFQTLYFFQAFEESKPVFRIVGLGC
jgi:hypothetical protein